MKPIYLVAYYFQKPATDRVKTQKPGWMKQPGNVSWDEQVAITRNLKNKDMTMGKVILDLANKKVVRNNWSDIKNFDELFLYFNKNYPDQTKNIMMQLDPGYYSGKVQNNYAEPVNGLNTETRVQAAEGILEMKPTEHGGVLNIPTMENFVSGSVAEVKVLDTPNS